MVKQRANLSKVPNNRDCIQNRTRAKAYCRANHKSYDNSTQLAEACADEMDLYDNHTDYPIPEWVFEVSADFYTVE